MTRSCTPLVRTNRSVDVSTVTAKHSPRRECGLVSHLKCRKRAGSPRSSDGVPASRRATPSVPSGKPSGCTLGSLRQAVGLHPRFPPASRRELANVDLAVALRFPTARIGRIWPLRPILDEPEKCDPHAHRDRGGAAARLVVLLLQRRHPRI